MEDVNNIRRNFLFVLNLDVFIKNSTPGVFACILRATKEGMISVRGEKIGWKNAESSTKQLQQENVGNTPQNNNNKKLEDWILSYDVVRWATDCLGVRLFFFLLKINGVSLTHPKWGS